MSTNWVCVAVGFQVVVYCRIEEKGAGGHRNNESGKSECGYLRVFVVRVGDPQKPK